MFEFEDCNAILVDRKKFFRPYKLDTNNNYIDIPIVPNMRSAVKLGGPIEAPISTQYEIATFVFMGEYHEGYKVYRELV